VQIDADKGMDRAIPGLIALVYICAADHVLSLGTCRLVRPTAERVDG